MHACSSHIIKTTIVISSKALAAIITSTARGTPTTRPIFISPPVDGILEEDIVTLGTDVETVIGCIVVVIIAEASTDLNSN